MIPDVNAPEILRFHRFLLGETGPRLPLFQKAISASVKPGDIVLDLGSGTGVLAYYACLAGARRVYAIEEGPIVELARRLAARNGFEDRIVFIEGRSDEAPVPEQVDVIVADVFGTFGLKSGGLRPFVDARQRWLKPGGAVLPEALHLFVAPVEAPQAYAEHVGFWSGRTHGFDWSLVQDYAANNRYPVRLSGDAFLGVPAAVAGVDLCRACDAAIDGEATFVAARRGVMHGFCGWFSAHLVGGISLTNDPSASTTNYSQTFFPLGSPLIIDKGDAVALHLQGHDGFHWRWRGQVRSANGAVESASSFEHATLWGFPASASRFQKK